MGRQEPLSYVVQTTGGEVWKRHVDQIGEVGDPGSVLSEEELIPTVERPTEEPLSEMDGTRENQVPSVVSLPSREALAVLPLPNKEGTETLPLPSPLWIKKKCYQHPAGKYHQLVDTHRG